MKENDAVRRVKKAISRWKDMAIPGEVIQCSKIVHGHERSVAGVLGNAWFGPYPGNDKDGYTCSGDTVFFLSKLGLITEEDGIDFRKWDHKRSIGRHKRNVLNRIAIDASRYGYALTRKPKVKGAKER